MVRPTAEYMIGVELGLPEQRGQVAVIEVILDLVAAPSLCSDQPPLFEKSKLMGYRGLADSRYECQISDAKRP